MIHNCFLAEGLVHREILSLNLPHLSKLKYLELDYGFQIEQLPTSLVQLALGPDYIEVSDLSYLISLKELVALYDGISHYIFAIQLALPQTIFRLEIQLSDPANNEMQLFNLKEVIIHGKVAANITEQNFPSLKSIQLIKLDVDSLLDSSLSTTKLINQGLIQSVKLIKNDFWLNYLVFHGGFSIQLKFI
ncbi:hypothetical protein P9112_013484 [Eukaryota sp. TZLM1-RC]